MLARIAAISVITLIVSFFMYGNFLPLKLMPSKQVQYLNQIPPAADAQGTWQKPRQTRKVSGQNIPSDEPIFAVEAKAPNIEPKPVAVQDAAQSLQKAKALMNLADMRSIEELKSAYSESLEYPIETVQTAILENYQAVKNESPFHRSKTLWFAKRLNGPKLRGMWQDILLRQTYDGTSIDTMQASDQHLSVAARAELTEEFVALDALGQLARSDRASLDLLKKIAVGADEFARTAKLLREDALGHIKNSSFTAFVQTKQDIRNQSVAPNR